MRLLNFETLPYYELPIDISFPEDRYLVLHKFFQRLSAIDRHSVSTIIALQHFSILAISRSQAELAAAADTARLVESRIKRFLTGRVADLEGVIAASHLLLSLGRAAKLPTAGLPDICLGLLGAVEEKLAAARMPGSSKEELKKIMATASMTLLVEISNAFPQIGKTVGSFVTSSFPDSATPDEALQLLLAMSSSKQCDSRAFERVLSKCMHLSPLTQPQLVILKSVDAALQVDLPGVLGGLGSAFSEFLAFVRDSKISRHIKDTRASYQIKEILKKDFQVQAESLFVGPHEVKVADAANRRAWLVWQAGERSSPEGQKVQRHLTALGWLCRHFEEVDWEKLSGYETKMLVVREDLKSSKWLDL